MNFKKEFWEKKIIGWEDGRYSLNKTDSNKLENFSDKLSSSLIHRQKIALKYLKPFIENSNIVELGCGSGLLTKSFIELKCKSYTGYDISEKAIERALDISKKNNFPANINFFALDINDIKVDEKIDVVFSLGLLDWLDENEIQKIFISFNNAKHLHSISENRKFNLYIFLHKLYVFLSYGFKSKGYKPTYHTLDDIKNLYNKNPESLEIVRDKKLKFGAFIKNF